MDTLSKVTRKKNGQQPQFKCGCCGARLVTAPGLRTNETQQLFMLNQVQQFVCPECLAALAEWAWQQHPEEAEGIGLRVRRGRMGAPVQ